MLKKWLVRIAIGVGVLLALCALVFIAAWTFTGFGPSAGMANQQYAAWQVNGLPITRDQVNLTPTPSPEDNALPEMREAIRLIEAVPRELAGSISFSDPAPYENGNLKAYVEARRPALEFAHRAAKKRTLHFDRDWDEGWNVLFPEYSKIKEIARCLAIDAEFKAKAGDWKSVARNIYTGRRLAAFASKDPVLISKLVGVAIDAIMLDAAGTCASELAKNPQALAALRKALTDTRWDIDPASAARGDAYLSLAACRTLTNQDVLGFIDGRFEEEQEVDFSSGRPLVAPKLVREGLPSAPLARAVLAEHMAFWNEFYPRMANPKEDLQRLAADMEARDAAYRASKSYPKQLAAGYFLLTFDGAFTAFDKRRSDERTAIAFVGILQYRLQHGTWPPTLKAAGVDAIDAIDGKPLRYLVAGPSARVYNIGRNRSDDGGLSAREAKLKKLSGTHIDNAYIYPWPKRVK